MSQNLTDDHSLPLSSSLYNTVHLLGGGWAEKINSPKRTSNIASMVYLKTAQVLETKISSLFLEKSFPVLLEFLPH